MLSYKFLQPSAFFEKRCLINSRQMGLLQEIESKSLEFIKNFHAFIIINIDVDWWRKRCNVMFSWCFILFIFSFAFFTFSSMFSLWMSKTVLPSRMVPALNTTPADNFFDCFNVSVIYLLLMFYLYHHNPLFWYKSILITNHK